MAAPNRAADVAALCAQHPEAFPQDAGNDAARLVLLRGVIIPALNRRDGGRWGCLTKTDQPLGDGTFKVPCDVLADRETGWLVDCLTGSGACWLDHEPPPPAWVWTAVDPVVVGPPPPDADASVPVWYAGAVLPVAGFIGTIVPQADGAVVLITWHGEVVSPQPDGRLELRPPGTVGGYELAQRVGPNLLRYTGSGSTWHLLVLDRV